MIRRLIPIVLVALALSGCGAGSVYLRPPVQPLSKSLKPADAAPTANRHWNTLFDDSSVKYGAKQVDLIGLLSSKLESPTSCYNQALKTDSGLLNVATPEAVYSCLLAKYDQLNSSEKVKVRNLIVDAIVDASTKNCHAYYAYLRKDQSSSRFMADFISSAAAGLSTVTHGASTAKDYAALAGLSSATSSAYDRNYFAGQAIEVVVESIEQQHQKLLGDLKAKYALSIDDWSLGLALVDVENFHAECGLEHALAHVGNAVHQREQDRKNIQGIVQALASTGGTGAQIAAAISKYDAADQPQPKVPDVSEVAVGYNTATPIVLNGSGLVAAFAVTVAPKHGQLLIGSPGVNSVTVNENITSSPVLTYVPAKGTVGKDQFSYVSKPPTGPSSSVITVELNVSPPPKPGAPSAIPVLKLAKGETSGTVKLEGTGVISGYFVKRQPVNGVVSVADGVATYTLKDKTNPKADDFDYVIVGPAENSDPVKVNVVIGN